MFILIFVVVSTYVHTVNIGLDNILTISSNEILLPYELKPQGYTSVSYINPVNNSIITVIISE